MPKSTPHSPFQQLLFPPTVAEVLDTSPGVQQNGNVETAWKLVAGLSYHSGGEILVLALAVGLLCRELSGGGPDEPGWVS